MRRFVAGGNPRGELLLTRAWWSDRGLSNPVERIDSVEVLRAYRQNSRVDTIARIAPRAQGVVARETSAQGRRVVLALANPLAVDEQAIIFNDGWIALARLFPYRVDWIAPDGRRVAGAPIPGSPVVVDRTEKLAAIARLWGTGLDAVPDDLQSPDAYPSWPAELPAFGPNALQAAADGRLLVRRLPRAGAAWDQYDVVGRTGAREEVIRLPSNERIDDIERLRRHPWHW